MLKFVTKHRGREVETPSAVINRLAERLSPRNLERAAQMGEQEMRKMMTRVADELVRRHSGPWPGGTTATTLSKRSGKGIRSIRNFRVVKKGLEVDGVWRLTGYMNFHERGGIIRAKRSQYLTIPLPAALDGRGVPLRQSARDWDNTFVAESRAGNLIVFQKRSRGDIVPLYVLKKFVRIPPRLGMRAEIVRNRPEFRRNLQAKIRELIAYQERGRR